MTFVVLTICGIVFIKKIPVSLLPDVDVPEIIVRVNYPNTTAAVLEQNVIRPIREMLANTGNLKSIESRAADHTGLLYLRFSYGTRMNMAFIEVNEKLDRLSNSFPRNMPRPQVLRINTSDIPVIRIQITQKHDDTLTDVTALAEKILKKRVEQLEGVSLVDINGKQYTIIVVTPQKETLHALNLDESIITATIQNANAESGGLNIKEGANRYFVKVVNTLDNENAIARLPVRLRDGSVITLGSIATVKQEAEQPAGYHIFNGKEGVVITVQKQPASRMNELVPLIKQVVEQFKKDYPKLDFSLTQDQTFLLDAGIDNLYQDLIYGGILTIALLFLFLGNWASPILMSISIPLSLILTFIFFYLFGISFNIISLSGLALGIGMLIDNSIVVIDNITRKRRQGMNMTDSSVTGTNEVMTPVISQVLTTVAVYAPLILLNGMSGALVADQSIALTISLGVSLLVAFVLAPLLYKMFLKTPPGKLKEETLFYQWVSKGYHTMIHHILRFKVLYFFVTILLMPVGIWLATKIPVSALPAIDKKESLVFINWEDPIDAAENVRRMKMLVKQIEPTCIVTEAEAGIKQFLLQKDNSSIQQSEIYFCCENGKAKSKTNDLINQWLQQYYPRASWQITDAHNAFTQLFNTNEPYLEARFKPLKSEPVNAFDSMPQLFKSIKVPYTLGAGLAQERSISLSLDNAKMALYGIYRSAVEQVLQQQFGTYVVSEIRQFGQVKTIRLGTFNNNLEEKLNCTVKSANGTEYPLRFIASFINDRQPKFITADKTGPYKSVIFDKNTANIASLQQEVTMLAAGYGFGVEFSGEYFEDRQQLTQLVTIFSIVLLLLYFILAIQYEDLFLPLIIMLTIPLGVTGGMFLLWITGGTLDVMAAIGFIVILGLIVDDPILKIETLKRLEKKYNLQHALQDEKLLERMIHEAGDHCLKPLLMVSLTTSIALVPVLFVGGIGNDLQKPLAIVIIGGLTVGTFFTTWFVPIAYWYLSKLRYRLLNKRTRPL